MIIDCNAKLFQYKSVYVQLLLQDSTHISFILLATWQRTPSTAQEDLHQLCMNHQGSITSTCRSNLARLHYSVLCTKVIPTCI